MNKRARWARRILRDHRRAPGLRSHTHWRGVYPLEWFCSRCESFADPYRIRVNRPLVSGQWRLEQHAVTDYAQQVQFTPEMAMEFLRRNGGGA